MDEVGPGGHFLDHDHTYDRFKTEIWRPKLIDRQNWENWTAAGSKTYRQRVHERVIEILETETEPLMDEAMFKELQAHLRAGRRAPQGRRARLQHLWLASLSPGGEGRGEGGIVP